MNQSANVNAELDGCCGIYAGTHQPEQPNGWCSCGCHGTEAVECPVGRGACPDLEPAGDFGVVRHLLAVHPEAPLTRSVFAALVEVQLVDTAHAAAIAEEAHR